MKSLSIIALAALSYAMSVHGQGALVTPVGVAVSEPDEEETAQALSEVQQQIEFELAPQQQAAVSRTGARVQAAQRQTERQSAKAEQAIELAQAAPAPPPTAQAAGTRGVQPPPGFPATAYHQRLQRIVSRGGGSPGRTLIIRTSDTDTKAQANLEEDLAVMSRIFDKALDQALSDDHSRRVMGIDVFFAPGSSPIRSLYLDGYGALFLMNVNFPLLPPPDKAEPAKEKSDIDSAWEDAKRELSGRPDAWDQVDKSFRFSGPPGPEQEYDEKKVGDLKDSLLGALKNATNIRNLKSDENITVCVFGGPSAGPRRTRLDVKRAPDAPSGDVVVASDSDDGVPARGSILTIRAKKSDADLFAKGKLTPEDFRKKVSVTTYAGGGSGWGGGGSGWGGGGAFGLVAP